MRFWLWLKSLFAGKATPPPPEEKGAWDLYRPEDRLLYSFYDGTRMVKADPMVLYQKVMAVGPELSIDLQVADSPLKDAAAAQQKALAKIRGIFGVRGFDEVGGLTESETTDLFDHFMDYIETVKKKGRQPPTPPPPTGDSSGSPVVRPPTPSISPSGSIAAASVTAPPTPPPSGPPSGTDLSTPASTTSAP